MIPYCIPLFLAIADHRRSPDRNCGETVEVLQANRLSRDAPNMGNMRTAFDFFFFFFGHAAAQQQQQQTAQQQCGNTPTTTTPRTAEQPTTPTRSLHPMLYYYSRLALLVIATPFAFTYAVCTTPWLAMLRAIGLQPRRTEAGEVDADLSGKVVIVTGANTGERTAIRRRCSNGVIFLPTTC